MNEDDMGAYEPLAGDELEEMLARYARVRLDPSPAETRRARAAIMEEAWRRRIAAGDAAAAAGTAVAAGRTARARRRGLFAGWSMRRLGVTFAAAVMAGLLVGSTVFAGSRAGGPLYGARLALEEVTLPADAASHLEAEIARAQTRLAEIVDASSRGDQTALAASVAAYETTVAAFDRQTGAGALRALEAVRQHRAVLLAILAGAPAAATSGIGEAISRSDALIARLDALVTSGDQGPGTGGGGEDNASGGGAGSGEQGERATPRPKPEATPRPAATPKADRTPKPAATPKADRTPKPAATPKPRPTQDSGAPDETPEPDAKVAPKP